MDDDLTKMINKMSILRLHLRRKWWEEIRLGIKPFEFRQTTAYWHKKLVGRKYDEIHLLLGYPKAGDESRLLRRKWQGLELNPDGSIAKQIIIHDEFGSEPVEVFIIDVSHSLVDLSV